MTLIIPQSLLKYKEYIEKTKTSFISISTSIKPVTHLENSKFGGTPYWPEKTPYPEILNTPAKLLAQINFSELTKQGITLPDFPKNGILQFFCPYEDDMLGLTFEDYNPDGYSHLVIYHEDIDKIPSDSEFLVKISSNNEYMPFEKELSLSFELKEEYLSLNDDYQVQKFYNFPIPITDEESDDFFENFNNAGSKLGGYAYFTQDDPRTYQKIFKPEDDWILLLQMDTDDNLMWGDSGVANWFIKRQDLINKNFKNVFYTWDCC